MRARHESAASLRRARHHGGTRHFHHRGHGRLPPRPVFFYTPFRGHAGHIGRERQASLRADAPQDHSAKWVQPAYGELLRFMRTEYVPGMRTTLGGGRPAAGQGLLSRQDPRVSRPSIWMRDAIHQLRRPPRCKRLHEAIARRHARDRLSVATSPAFLKFPAHRPALSTPNSPGELLMHARVDGENASNGKAGGSSSATCRGARFASSRWPEDLAPFYTAGTRRARDISAQHLRPGEAGRLYNLTALTLHESAPRTTHFRYPSRWSTRTSRCSASSRTSPLTAKAGRCIASSSGLEMGLYDTPYERFGMLGYQILARPARLGRRPPAFHAQGWTAPSRRSNTSRQYTALPEREDRHRGGSLHRLAGAGAVVLPGRGARFLERTRARRARGRRSTSAFKRARFFTTRCWELGSGAAAGTCRPASTVSLPRGGRGALSGPGVASRGWGLPYAVFPFAKGVGMRTHDMVGSDGCGTRDRGPLRPSPRLRIRTASSRR